MKFEFYIKEFLLILVCLILGIGIAYQLTYTAEANTVLVHIKTGLLLGLIIYAPIQIFRFLFRFIKNRKV